MQRTAWKKKTQNNRENVMKLLEKKSEWAFLVKEERVYWGMSCFWEVFTKHLKKTIMAFA